MALDGKPPACEWRRVSVHSLTYARLYPSGWWCERHAPHTWPTHHQPSANPTAQAAAPPAPRTDKELAI